MYIIGYSGHALTVIDTALSAGLSVDGYFAPTPAEADIFNLQYGGSETEAPISHFRDNNWFIAIGDNNVRRRVAEHLAERGAGNAAALVHAKAYQSPYSQLKQGTLIAAGAVINAAAELGEFCIANTACVIEHECRIGAFSHIAPGATLAGNVSVGENSFIGANATVRQGIRIGNNVTIGAGSVVVRDVADNVTAFGNPCRTRSTG